jgi:hypothetical protein
LIVYITDHYFKYVLTIIIFLYYRLMGDTSAPPQSDKNSQPAEKRVNRQIGDQSAPQQSEKNAQPSKKRVSKVIGNSSAPQHKENNKQPTNKRVNRVIGNSSAPPQSEMNAQATENRVNTLVSASGPPQSGPPQTEMNAQPTENRVNTLVSASGPPQTEKGPPQTEKITQPTRKRVRGATWMAHFLLKRLNGEKIPIDFDQWTKKPLGENRKKFKSHVGSIARSKVSILVDHCDLVSETVKNKIWEDIMVILFMIVNCNTWLYYFHTLTLLSAI